MNTAYFIARRIAANRNNAFSGIIMRIAAIAVALSVAAMIMAGALINGFQQEISEKAFGFWGHIHISHFGRNYSFDNTPIGSDQPFYPLMDSLAGVRHIQQYATKPGIIKSGDQIEGIILKGVSTDFDWTFLKKHLRSGNLIRIPADSASNGILISSTTAGRLGLQTGSPIIMHFVDADAQRTRHRRFSVEGIYSTGLEEFDKLFAIIDLRHIRQLNHWGEEQIGGFEVFIDDESDLERMDAAVFRAIGPDLDSRTIRAIYPNLFDWLRLQSTNETVIISLMSIVAMFNMITALLILILERTRMIGALKAMGAGDGLIRKVFLYGGSYIILIGLLAGNVLGLGLAGLQDQFGLLTLPEKTYYVSVAPVRIDWMKVTLLNIGTFAICYLALIIPSMLVSRINPVRTIGFR